MSREVTFCLYSGSNIKVFRQKKFNHIMAQFNARLKSMIKSLNGNAVNVSMRIDGRFSYWLVGSGMTGNTDTLTLPKAYPECPRYFNSRLIQF